MTPNRYATPIEVLAMPERASAPSDNKRRFSARRLPRGRVKATYRRGGPEAAADLPAVLLDVSETGVRLIVAHALKAGSEISVSLQGQANTRPIVQIGKVAWALPTTDGAFCIGVGFHRRLTHREYLDFARDLPAFG